MYVFFTHDFDQFFWVIMVIKRSRPILRYVWQSGLVGWGWMLEVGVDVGGRGG